MKNLSNGCGILYKGLDYSFTLVFIVLVTVHYFCSVSLHCSSNIHVLHTIFHLHDVVWVLL